VLPGGEEDPVALSGSLDEIVAQLNAERDLHDVSYVTITGACIDAFAPVVAKLTGA
jgi:hypothetical protein